MRTRHCKNPTGAFILIPDHARRLYRIPNHPGFASRPCLEIKLLGAIVHGQCVVLNFVPKAICDDANLNATVLLLVLKLLSDQREAEGKGRQLPPKIHVQVDGASTNWCKTMFAFIGFLVMSLICIEAVYARNPVGKGPPHDGAFTVDAYSPDAGNTHEDIDGLYGIYAQELEKESWDTPEEFEAILRRKTPGKKVYVNWITGTLNFDKYLSAGLDPALRNFSRQHQNYHPGMHVLRYVRFSF